MLTESYPLRGLKEERMTSQNWIIFPLVLLLFVSLFSLVRGVIRKKGKYELKKLINNLRPMLTVIWIAYFFLVSAVALSNLDYWISLRLQDAIKGSAQYLVVVSLPFVSAITIYYIAIKVLVGSGRLWIKYTDSELLLIAEEREKFRKQIRRFVPWLRK